MHSYQRYNGFSLIYLIVRYVLLTGIHVKKLKKKRKCHANWLISENVNEVIEPMIRRKRHKKSYVWVGLGAQCG